MTAVIMVQAAFFAPPEELLLRFDRPFLFALVHLPSGAALFAGAVTQPEAWGRQDDSTSDS